MSPEEFIKSMSPAELKAFLRKVSGPERRIIEGDEREQILTMLLMVEPTDVTNNQHSITEHYEVAGRCYQFTYFGDTSELAEILPD